MSASHETLRTIRFEGELLPKWAELLDLAARLSPVSEEVRRWFSRLTTGPGVEAGRVVIQHCQALRTSLEQHRESLAAELQRNGENVQPAQILGAWRYALDTMIQQAGKRGHCSWFLEGAEDEGRDWEDGGDVILRRV